MEFTFWISKLTLNQREQKDSSGIQKSCINFEDTQCQSRRNANTTIILVVLMLVGIMQRKTQDPNSFSSVKNRKKKNNLQFPVDAPVNQSKKFSYFSSHGQEVVQ